MKLLLLFVAFVAFAYCDSDNCRLDTEWAQYQTESEFVDALWEDKELIAWGMDGDNKWNDFWRFHNTYSTGSLAGLNHYQIVTCSDIIQRQNPTQSTASIPGYDMVMTCGGCTLTAGVSECNCYPYYDVAGSYQTTPSPYEVEGEDMPEAVEGWPSAYANPDPPYEVFPIADGSNAWTLENCKQYMPYYIYYYTYRLKLTSGGEFYKSFGISRAFLPNKSKWDDFCDRAYPATVASPFVRECYVPSFIDGSAPHDEKALFGAEYQYQEGDYRYQDEDISTPALQFYHDRFETGCHMKSRHHRFPTASYCGDDSGWKYGAGTTAHVRFGCDTGTFQDTTTDGFDIDDGDCQSLYLQFDQLNPLTTTVDIYGPFNNEDEGAPDVQFGIFSKFSTSITTVHQAYAEFVGDNLRPNSACWFRSTYIDHRSDIPSYRTPCSAGVLAVPVLALLSTLFVFLRNLF